MFSKKENRNIKDEVPFQENYIKTEDELNISTETELNSPIYEVKNEISEPEHESPNDLNEGRNVETNKRRKQDQSNPQFVSCIVCEKVLKNNRILSIHYKRMHSDSKVFQCDICGKTCGSMNNIALHMNTHKKYRTKDFQCHICENYYFDKQYLQQHISNAHNPKLVPCDICGKLLKKNSLKEHHRIMHSIINLFRCDICGKTFKTRANIDAHMVTHKILRVRDFHCKICLGSYFDENGLRSHMLKNHEKPKHLTCSLCRITFRTEEGLRKHKLLPHRAPCKVCGKMLRKYALKEHLRRVHFKIKPYQCDICGKKLYRTSLASHVTTHIGLEHRTKDHKCDLCNKAFFDRIRIKKHMKHCHRNSKFSCDLCKRTYTSKSYLKKHRCPMKVNKWSKIDCDTCGEVFQGPNVYFKHMINIHKITPDKKQLLNTVACDVCEKRFFTKRSLLNHQSAHEKRIFTCDYPECQKKFLEKKSLRRHTLTIHKSIREPCPVGNGCKYSAARKDCMTRHLKEHKKLSPGELQSYLKLLRTMNLF
ncbi:CLUMA_CG000550, isoform A [Clunio marinus]|uniref:CLUMA_CG000550, isoform A n=1 Tax=Clunio marinus TaxID=568069 RepID=A0A1J1HFC9_9DIPT|nr:CLUMA_CG000550, isoform A [Clunio marinus]